jgi:hypothetical protein
MNLRLTIVAGARIPLLIWISLQRQKVHGKDYIDIKIILIQILIYQSYKPMKDRLVALFIE